MDRCEPLGKKGDPVEARVPGEVEEDVGGVVAQERGDCVVRGRGDEAPLVGEGAEALGHGIDLGMVVVEDYLEGGAVEMGEERFEKIGDRVCAEVCREDDESQACAGDGAGGGFCGLAGAGEGGGHALAGLHVLGKKLFAGDVGEVVQAEESGALRIVLPRIALDGPAVGGQGFGDAVTAFEGQALPCVGVGELRVETEGAVEASERFAELADIAEGDSEVAPSGGSFRLD